jgi:WD40 repeat protein
MRYSLLLASADGSVTAAPLIIRELRESPGEGLSVHFRPVRKDLLFESAKIGGQLAYRILTGEGVVRSQLWVEYEVLGSHVNVSGRSADLLFALALITAKWKPTGDPYPAIAATGVLDSEGAALCADGTAVVHPVRYTVEKVAAAVRILAQEALAVIFYPQADAESVSVWSRDAQVPTHVRLQPVGSLDEALSVLGIELRKVYLRNPFRGLEPFDFEHRSIFFGRDTEVREVCQQLLRREAAGTPGLLVEGASGSGKSSFIRAGLLPTLVDPGSQSPDVQAALRCRPILSSVRRAIWRVGLLPAGADERQFAQSIRQCWNDLPEYDGKGAREVDTLEELASALTDCWPGKARFVWLLDQFEDFFTLELSAQVVDSFGRFLAALQTAGVWTLASIRADAVPQLKQHQQLREVFGPNEGQYYLETIGTTALEDVIARPAQAAALIFGAVPSGGRLDQLLREEAHTESGNVLPLLQFTLRELYRRRSGRELTFAAYEELGGFSGSVATTAAQVLAAQDSDAQQALPRVFRSLVSVDEAGQASRRYAPLQEMSEDPSQLNLVLSLVNARLCVTDQQEEHAIVWFAHEALLRTWPTLVDWLHREAGLMQTRELAQRETRLWQLHDKRDAWLASRDKLTVLKQLTAAGIALPEPVREFLSRSERRVRSANRARLFAVWLIAALAIAASGAGLLASKKQHEAEYQAAETLKAQRRLLVESASQRFNHADIGGAQGILLEVLANPGVRQVRTPDEINLFQKIRASDAQVTVLSGHDNVVTHTAYSPDGLRIVTASDDGTARIWDAGTGIQLAVLADHGTAFAWAAYSPDGTRIVTASSDRTVRVWDAGTGAIINTLVGHTDKVVSAAFSADGRRIVSASADKTARVWDAQTGVQLAVLKGHQDRVACAAFSPDGSRIVTASWDKTARIWDAHTGAALGMLSGHSSLVVHAAYSPDGSRIVTASWDGTARIWDASSSRQLAVFPDPTRGYVESAAYSPDGARIVTASSDKAAHIWDAQTGEELAVLAGHTDRMTFAEFSPDGTRVVTASLDQTARTWRAHPRGQIAVLSGHRAVVASALYSPDGARILTSSSDGSARIWDARTGAQLFMLPGDGKFIYDAEFSPDGSRIVTASWDKTAGIWDSLTGRRLSTVSGHDDVLQSAAYSPDNTRIVTTSDDKSVRVWDARTGAQLVRLTGHGSPVISAVYSPDGMRIVTASLDKTARIWNARSGEQLTVLSGHSDAVHYASFSPDGNRIVTASYDHTARIWDAHSGMPLTVLAGHEDLVVDAVYSPDGTHILTASVDKTARIWDAGSGVQLAVLWGHTRLLETARYSPDGKHIVTASDDKTARIWDIDLSAGIGDQISWSMAAQTDPLSDVDRAALGLPDAAAVSRSQLGERHDPGALARSADRDERASLAQVNASGRHTLLLNAFRDYAAAVELARDQGWPDKTWKHWRYRRATLARLLADDGVMQPVAEAYEAILKR